MNLEDFKTDWLALNAANQDNSELRLNYHLFINDTPYAARIDVVILNGKYKCILEKKLFKASEIDELNWLLKTNSEIILEEWKNKHLIGIFDADEAPTVYDVNSVEKLTNFINHAWLYFGDNFSWLKNTFEKPKDYVLGSDFENHPSYIQDIITKNVEQSKERLKEWENEAPLRELYRNATELGDTTARYKLLTAHDDPQNIVIDTLCVI